MAKLGMGAMLGLLGGNEDTVAAYNSALGRIISNAQMDEDVCEDGALVLEFEGGGVLTLWDAGRSCCENRYITCDDDLSELAGKVLSAIEPKAGPEIEDEWGQMHEQMFIEVLCADGTNATLTTHNEHNGYYGGFWLKLQADWPQ